MKPLPQRIFSLWGAFFVMVALTLPAYGYAQTKMKIQIGSDQKLMFDAAQKVMKRDYRGAEQIYSQVLALNRSDIDAWLQRAVVRRELGNKTGMKTDAQTAVNLADAAILQLRGNNASLYSQRAMGYRLLRNFDQAKKDIRMAMQMGGKSSLANDLKAIELEEKTAVD